MVAVAVEARSPQQQGSRPPTMNVPRHVLDAFDGLVAMEDKKRTAAGMVVLQHVDQILRGGTQGKELPAGAKYIMQRLVSGLASTRLSAREGYFSTLCLLLRLHPSSFKPAFVLSLLTSKKSATMKALTKDEIRDQLVAELLLCGAIVRSGQARRCPQLVQCVVNQLCAMRSKKSYMDITATQFLINLMEGCEGDSMHEVVWQSLQAELQGPVAELSPSQLWLRLVLLRKHRKEPPVWLTSTLSQKNHEALRETIMKSITSLPEIHPVLSELISNLAASSPSLLVKFWEVTLEPLQGHASPGKLQILFHLLRFTLPHLRAAEQFKAVVTSSVVGLLLNSLTQPLRDLKEAAKGVTAALVQLVKDSQAEDSEVQLAVVQALVTAPGSVRFDQLAGHKVLAVMMPSLTLTSLKGTTSILLEKVKKPRVAKDLMVAERNYAAHVLGNLLGQPRACAEEAAEWRMQQLAALLKAVVLTPRKEEEREGDTTKDAFFKALGKQVGHIKEYKDILLILVKAVDKELKAEKVVPLAPSLLDEKGREQWSKVSSRLTMLSSEFKEQPNQDIAKTIFQVLYCQMALHLFVDATVATETIDELIACHKEVKKLGILNDAEEEDEDEEEEEEENIDVEGKPSWVELVTEMLLTLMTQEMHLFRSVVQGLFWLLTPLMTAMALSLLTDVLDTENARQLLNKEGEEDSDEEEEEEDKDEDESEDEEGKKEKHDEDTDSDEEEEEAGDDDDPDLFALRKKMLNAAGGIEVDVDMDSVPQEELSRMDERLGALWAEYQGRKKKKRKRGGSDNGPQLTQEEQSLMHFQTRVCDMLMVYIKAAPNMALQVGLIIPVFKALRMADFDARQKDLQHKLTNVISILEKKKKFNTFGDITIDGWKKTVNEFFSLACQVPERFASIIQSCYSQLMHCGRLLLGQTEGAAVRPDNFLTITYISHLKSFFTENHLPKLQPFTEPCTYNIGGLWQIAATLVHFAFDSSVKMQKQCQALRALQQLYSNKTLVAERSGVEAHAVEQDLNNKVTKTLGSMQPPINAMYTMGLFRILHCLLQVDRRTEPKLSLDWGNVHDCVEAFRERITKITLRPIRREYNVLSEALRSLLGFKKGQKKDRGIKRIAEEVNKDGYQENQMKKRKNKINTNDLVNINSPPDEVKDGKNKNKKKKKNKQIPSKEEITNSEDIVEIYSENYVAEIKNEISDDKDIMVINGNDNEIECLGEVNTEETKMGKKKKKDKQANTEESTNTSDQADTPLKKKKKKDKLMDTSSIVMPSTIDDFPQKEDSQSEETKDRSKKKKKKNKLSNAVAILTDGNSNPEAQDTQSEERTEEVAILKQKKKKDNLHKKRKQNNETEETAVNEGEKGEHENPAFTLAPEPPLKKKKKKKKHTLHQHSDL